MTRCGGATLADVPERIGWDALAHLVAHLDAGSATVCALAPDVAKWEGPARVPMLLAELLDAVNALTWVTTCANTPRGKPRPKRPKPYPRPGASRGGTKVGRDPVPVSEFEKWWRGGE